jgi:hypothetical protein
MTSPAGPGGPPIARVNHQADLLAALSEARMGRAMPVVVLIGGAAGLGDIDAEAWLPLVRDGVMRPAADLGAVVVDGGTDAGIMALAGRARREVSDSVGLVGVAPRGRVAAGDVNGGGQTALESNHSLVLLVPGEEWGSESAWLISAARVLSDGQPVVAVLFDGGPIALGEARECAMQGWPLIVVAGTGRTADLIAGRAGTPEPDGVLGHADVRVVQVTGGARPLAAELRALLAPPATEQARRANRRPERPATTDYPALYVAAAGAAKRGQAVHRRLSLAGLGLTAVGLTLILATAWLQPLLGLPEVFMGRLPIVISALSFLVALVLKFIARANAFDADWYNGRALAETVKGLAWRYMMRVPPYATADADRRFTVDLTQVLRRAPGFRQATDRLPLRPQQISTLMREVRGLPVAGRRAYYLTERLLDQADWYQARSVASSRAGTRWFWLSVALEVAAAGLALVALAGGGDPLLRIIAVLASIALAVTAWSQLNRYDELSRTYATAFHELSLIAAAAGDDADRAPLQELVRDGEEAIGREHRLWVAQRGEMSAGSSDIDDGSGADQSAGASSPNSDA